jgi:hypothetical protein
MLNYIKSNGYELIDLVDSAIDFVLTCKSCSNKNLFIEFILNTKEIFIHTLINIYSYGYNIITNKIEKENDKEHYKIKQKKYEEYKELVSDLKEKRNTFENENIKNLKNSENFDDELACIICYKQIADHRIKPCLHRGCKECLLTYMSDNVKCFMCRGPIESIQKISMEELEKIKKEKEVEKNGNKNEKKEDDKIKNNIKEEKISKEDNKNNYENIFEEEDSFHFSDEYDENF